MFLGIDVGTSSVKVVAIADDGAVAARSASQLAISRPRPLWSEQDPDDWWTAADAATRAIDPAVRRVVRAIGLAGQMHGATILGRDDKPLRPAILWNDGRSFAECAALEQAEPRSREITGNLAMAGFTAPKLLWVQRHEPALFDRIGTVLLPKDYVRLAMTGDKASDMSDSAGTLWLDIAARAWSPAMLAATGLDRRAMPTLHEGTAITGTLRPEVAADWGMARVPVVAGGGDNAAAAAGVGIVDPEDALLSLGTSGVTFVVTDRPRPDPARAVHAFCHCVPHLWHQMAVHLSAASCLDWAARQLGLPGPGAVLAAAERAGSPGGELFLPYLSGERTPHNDPHVRAAFLGLSNETTPERLCAAVLEGVAFAHAEGLSALREAGARVDRMVVVGGGARSLHWGRILASVLGARLIYIEGGEVGPALGAAKLAAIASLGAGGGEVCARPPVRHEVAPDDSLRDRLLPKLRAYRAASAAVRAL